MTIWCMATGVTFGERKFNEGITDDLVAELEKMIEASEVDKGLSKVPQLLRDVWANKVTMKAITQLDWLQDAKFEDQGGATEDDVRSSLMHMSTQVYAERGEQLARRGSAMSK